MQNGFISSFINKFRNAFSGLIAGLRYDISIIIQAALAVVVVILCLFLNLSNVEWLFVFTAIFIVLITEYLNSAVEDFCDLLVKNYNLHVKEIKDIAAAAVLLAAIYALVVAFFIIKGRIS